MTDEGAAAEYVRLDAEAELVLSAIRAAYARARDARVSAEREVFRRVLDAHRNGQDPGLVAEVALRELGFPLEMDVVHEPEQKHAFLGNMRYACDGHCIEQYERLGRPDTTEARKR